MPYLRYRTTRRQALLGLASLGLSPLPAQAAARSAPAGPTALPFRVAAKLNDAAEVAPPAAVRLQGWLGQRVALNASQRLLSVDTVPLLAGFKKKPGSHPWIGEHVGKWLHAATLAWANSGDPALRAKLDATAAELIAAQESDGYLGTYPPDKRFGLYDGADWDVWSHKYGLIGLLTYHQYTGDSAALAACRKAADLLIATFPAQRSILAAGTHMGMAATSVLEPIVLLYRLTADERYLDFARYIVKSWDEDKGPAIVKTLLSEKQVNKVANGKAYEMLSNLVGLCELARVTGDRSFVEASLNAWQDIVDKRLFITGSTSQWEHFPADHEMRADVAAHIGETCVTTTWIQFNLSLLQLTGQARFGDELERSFYNHLAAAQHPQGQDWCYYTALEGRKQYDKEITCCHSSGPRGMALAPQAAYLRSRAANHDVLLVNTFETSTTTLTLGGRKVRIEQHSGFPHRGQTELRLHLAKPARFALKLRLPAWAQPLQMAGATARDGWAELPLRTWKDGDVVPVRFTLGSRLIAGEHMYAGRAALAWGPFVLAFEGQANLALDAPYRLALAGGAATARSQPGAPLAFEAGVVDQPLAPARAARFLPFADAGSGRGVFRVWLREPGASGPGRGESLLIGGQQSRSRPGNATGSIVDEDAESFVTTFDGRPAEEDWFAVTLAQPATASRIVFTHGAVFHDGGWFDAQQGKPRVQIQRHAGAEWETIGALENYPATTAVQSATLSNPWFGKESTLKLAQPVSFVAVRVIGRPASGDTPGQAYASCTELQAFAR